MHFHFGTVVHALAVQLLIRVPVFITGIDLSGTIIDLLAQNGQELRRTDTAGVHVGRHHRHAQGFTYLRHFIHHL